MGSTENTPRIRNIKTIDLKDSELNIFIIGKSKNPNNIMFYPEIGDGTSSSYGLIGLKEINKSYYTEETYNCEYHCFNRKFKQNDVTLKKHGIFIVLNTKLMKNYYMFYYIFYMKMIIQTKKII